MKLPVRCKYRSRMIVWAACTTSHNQLLALLQSFVQDLQRGELELVAACDLNGEGGSKAANHAARYALAEAGFPVRMPNRPGLTQIEILERVRAILPSSTNRAHGSSCYKGGGRQACRRSGTDQAYLA